MSERETPASNVSPLPGQDQDVDHVEALLEQLLVTSVDADVTWSIVRERMGFDQDVAPLRTRHRPRRALALAIAAALMLSGVALAALANQGQPSGHPRNIDRPRLARGRRHGVPSGDGQRPSDADTRSNPCRRVPDPDPLCIA